jgi:hypothetical protein
MRKPGYLLGLMDSLEPFRLRMTLKTHKMKFGRLDFFNVLQLYTYSHSIIRFKELLLYLDPELLNILLIFELLYRLACLDMFNYCDSAHKSPSRIEAIILMIYVFDELRGLKEMPTLDPSIAEHLQLALKSRLKVLCAPIFHSDDSKALRWKLAYPVVTVNIDYIKELSSFLPPHYSGCSSFLWADLRDEVLPHLTAINMDSSSCLLRRPNSIERHHDAPQTDNCCCGWTVDSIPSSVLAFFSYSTESFARHFFARRQSRFNARELMNTVFGPPSKTNVSLRKKIAIFREALYWTLRKTFHMSRILNLHPTVVLPENQLAAQAKGHRQMLLVIILEEAVAINHDFWISRGPNKEEDKTEDTKSTHKLIFDFMEWKENSPSKFKETSYKLFMRLIDLHFLRWKLVTGMSFDDYLTSLM